MARGRSTRRDVVDIEIEPIRRPPASSATPRRPAPGGADGDPDGAVDGPDADDADDGVQWQVVAVVVAAALALVSVSVVGLTRRAVDPIAAASTTSLPETVSTGAPSTVDGTTAPGVDGVLAEEGAPWPSDVAIVVASDHGIDRVTGEKGEVVITRLEIPLPAAARAPVDPTTGSTIAAADGAVLPQVPSVERAFEVQDGSLLFQYTRGDIVRLAPDGTLTTLVEWAPGVLLEDADMPGADPNRLTVVYRLASDDEGAAFALGVMSGDRTVVTPIMGGWGVSYGRFTVWAPDVVAAAWIDDTATRGTAFVNSSDGEQARTSIDPSGASPLGLAGDPNEGGWVTLTTDHVIGALGSTQRVMAQTSTVSGVDVRGSSLVVQRDGNTSEYYDLAPYRRYAVPVRGFATVSRFVHSPIVDNVSSALTQDNPRTCIVGFPGNDHRIALYSGNLDADEIAAAETAVVDGFAALVSEQADGSFVVRVTFDACELHLRVVDVPRQGLAQILASADVGHVGTWLADCGPTANCVAPPTATWPTVPEGSLLPWVSPSVP